MQLANEHMIRIARRTLVELMSYQYIAWNIDNTSGLKEFYNKIVIYFK